MPTNAMLVNKQGSIGKQKPGQTQLEKLELQNPQTQQKNQPTYCALIVTTGHKSGHSKGVN
jgi:hypothetical protein